MKITICLLALVLSLASCRKNEWVTQETSNDTSEIEAFETYLNVPTWGYLSYSSNLPAYLRNLGMQTPAISRQKATLGRVLFYDKNLSLDRSTSCASCHQQQQAFADNAAFSTGIAGRKTSRNSPPLANVAHFAAHYRPQNGPAPLLFWDERAPSVAAQSRATFANPSEMGMEMPQVVSRVKEQPYYPWIWKEVYGDFNVTEEQVLECLAEFVGSMGSYRSKFDEAMEKAQGDINKNGADTSIQVLQVYHGTQIDTTITLTLSESEDRGRALFVTHCTKCHSPIRPIQEVFAACTGLDEQYADQGIGALTGNPADNGVFKSPSLRNIALTGPYMHDGRFQTLEEVIEFYSTGVKNHPNLHPEMRINGSINRHFTTQQKQDLVAFLKTLTDDSFVRGEPFSNPFK